MQQEPAVASSSWHRFRGPAMRLPRWLIWSGLAAVTLFGAYLLAGFYLVPGLVRSQATAWVKTNLDKPIALGAIKFNPLTFVLDVNDIAIPDGQKPLVAVGHLRVGFSILSLFQSAYRFNAIILDQPRIRAIIRPDGSLNLIELEPRTHSEGPSPAVRIATLSVNQGQVIYADDSQAQRPEEVLTPITFTLKDFQTNQAQGGVFSFNGKGESGERFVWTGNLSIAPIASRGQLTASGLQTHLVEQFFGGRLPVALQSGVGSFIADYDFAYGKDGLRVNLSLPSVALTGLSLVGKKTLFDGRVTLDKLTASIGPIALAGGVGSAMHMTAAMPRLAVEGLAVTPSGAANGIRLADAALTDARLDYGARKISLGGLVLDGADLPVRRERGGKINLMAMLPQKSAGPATASTAQPWNMSLAKFTLNNAALHLEDRAVAPALKMTIAPLNLMADGASTDLSQPVNLHLDTHIDGKGSFTGDATVTPASKAGDLKFTLAGLSLRDFAGYLPLLNGTQLRSGNIGASGDVHFQGADIAALRYRGDAFIDNLDIVETAINRPLFAWRSFSFKAIDVRNKRADIASARLVRPVGQVAVLADRSFNFTALMAPKSASGAAIPIQAAPAKPISSKAAPSKQALSFRLKRLEISGGTMGFADYSMQPNFQAQIDALGGTITNISNHPGDAAAIDLSGQVMDQYSPVAIKGTMDLLGFDRMTDMHLSFRNIELPVFNPYSGRYAGYAIAKGKLTTELTYKINNRALDADHHIIIDQLEWGQATPSQQAVTWPVRLATALLKDENGVIDLDVPVKGSLDDPTFHLGPIIWQVIGNIIEKAVTAPFRLIGSLFEGAEKAQYVDFAPGSAVLPQGAAGSLDALAKALAHRPQLKLDIPAGPGSHDDATGMEDAQIDAMLLAPDKGKTASVTALKPDDIHDRLEDAYRAKLGKRPDIPDFSPDALKAAPGATPDMKDDDRQTLLESQWLRDQLRTAFAPTSAQLTALGTARATAIRDALLAGNGIDPARVFMATNLAASTSAGQSRLELKLE